LRGRLRLAAAALRPSRGGRRGGGWRDLVVVGLFAGLSWLALGRVFERLALEHTPPGDAALVLGLALTAAFVGLAVFDLHQAVSALVLDSDLTLLRVAPLAPRALALLKLFDAAPPTALLTVMLVVPALAGFARAYPLPGWAWLAVAPGVLALWLAPLAFGMSVALPLVRRVPPRRGREALAVFATASLVVLWVLQAFVLPRVTDRSDGLAAPLVQLARGWDRMGAALPPFWLARALGAAARARAGEPVAAAGALALGATLALGAIAIAALALYLAIAARQLEPVLEALGPGAPGTRVARGSAAGARLEPERGLTRALLARDARLISRDWAVLVDVVVACLLWVLIPLASLPLEHGFGPIAGPMLVSLAVGLGYEVAGRSAPFERGGLAWVKLAPIDPAHWLMARLAGVALFSLPILGAATLAISAALRPAPAALASALLVTVSALAASLGLGIWTGLRYGDPAWVNPRAMLAMRGRLLASVGLLVQIAMWVALMWFAAPPDGPGRPWLLLLAPVMGAMLGGLGVRMAMRELARLEPAA